MLRLSDPHQFLTKLIVLRSELCSDWQAIQCIVIGQIPQTCDGNVTAPYHVVMPCPGAMGPNIRLTINESFVAFSEDIITDYNDSYGLFTSCVMSRKHNTMSAFVIIETPNKHSSTCSNSRLNSQ